MLRPGPYEAGRRRALVDRGDGARLHQFALARADDRQPVQARRLGRPARHGGQQRAHHRALPVQIREVGQHGALPRTVPVREDPLVVRARAAAQRLPPLRVPPAQLRVEGGPYEIVRVDAARPVLHGRQPPQPLEVGPRVRHLQQRREQRFGGDQHLRGGLQGRPVQRRRHRVQQADQQCLYDLGGLGGVCLGRALRRDVGDQGERQRMTAGEGEGRCLDALRHAAPAQQLPAVRRVERRERHRVQQPLPGRVEPPGERRGVARGEGDEGVGGQFRQQPAVQG